MKEFSWSFSGLNAFETCAKQYYELRIAKSVKEQENPKMLEGNRVHQALRAFLASNIPLPITMERYQKWADAVKAGPGTLLVEQKYALTRQFTSTSYFGDDVWFRGIGDAVRLDGPVGLVVDWKTGIVKPDSVQLFLMAQCLFSFYPNLQKVRSEFIWLQHNTSTPEVYDRRDLGNHWLSLLPRVKALENAVATVNFPPHPSGLCKKHCPVASCAYWRKGNR